MKSVHNATGRLQNGKRYQFTNYGSAIKFERLLKPFKGDVSGGVGGKFSKFEGGSENG
jgi:hypothetical protein